MSELVTLSWSEHGEMLKEGLWASFEKEFETDAEIFVTEDANVHTSIAAHSLVLSIFCPIFRNTTEKGILIEGMDKQDVMDLIRFMYCGKICVQKDRLDRVRAGAASLGLIHLVNLIEQLSSCQLDKELTVEHSITPGKRKRSFSENDLIERTKKSVLERSLHEKQVSKTIVNTIGLPKIATDNNKIAEGMSDSVENCVDKDGEEVQLSCSCGICDKVLTGRFCQFQHLRCNKTNDLMLWCPYCPFGAELHTDFNAHMNDEHSLDPDGRPLKKGIHCLDPDCRFTCFSSSEMAQHRFSSHPKSHTCDKCSASFINKANLTYHTATVHGHDPFSCNMCAFQTVHKSKFKTHLLTHEKKVVCSLCGVLVTSASLETHQQCHSLTLPSDFSWSCHMCTFQTTIPYSIKFHLRVVHKSSLTDVIQVIKKLRDSV